MSIHVALEHRTAYRFDRPVRIGPHTVRLRPAPHCRTPILAYSLSVAPDPHFLNWQQDPFGNHLARVVFPEKATELEIVVGLVADLTVINPFDFFLDEAAERWGFGYDDDLASDLAPYRSTEAPGPLLQDWMAALPARHPDDRTIDVLVDINRRLAGDIAYTVRMEPGVQAPDATLEKRLGSCRDTGWLLVAALRQLGLAARFVSGYLVQLVADQAPLDGPAGTTVDFTDLHAWAEVYLPGAGWIGLDPTSGLVAGEGHIPLACTPAPSSAAPIEGVTDPCGVTFEFANTVTRIHEDPRVTKPYDEITWTRIDALGATVDERLAAGDVRLTMGGEPTFVSADDMEAPEWTVDADGEDKRAKGLDLGRHLANRFATGALLHHGQGKWYPGESLPRWQLSIVWRPDGQPIWRHPALLADPSEPGGSSIDDARSMATAIAARLGIGAERVHGAWEDGLHQLLVAAQRPAGEPPARDVVPGEAPEDDLDARSGDPVAWVVPVHHREAQGWATTDWTLRRGRLVLMPGDSPAGLRLPLASLSWHEPPPDHDRSTFDVRPPLADAEPSPMDGPTSSSPPAPVVPVADAPTSALCVEVRDGRLHVFLPPLTHLEPYLELVGAVEHAAALAGRPVVLEGYPPPGDPRVEVLGIAPDPGVLEVNVHPAASWAAMVATTEALDEEARACRLATETFHLDGTHAGTGGGSHLTIGGPTPADSPVLRRPDLLRSLLTFWQHHPSLSYLFAGRFVGPTSQAPRVDEARHDSLYELEVAFAEMDRLAEESDEPRPWLVDRLLRNLLVDVGGNTHRAEFCIDKLFSPDGERGRLGLVELRGFEMPPHPRMQLVQALLVRSIIARCWDEPYRAPLIRWGTELHDRFLLPWYVADDAAAVATDLREHGLGFDARWLAPFLEFRFPRYGSVEVAGVQLELRAAIEPWPVLGEETRSGATARYVDSSVERMQVLVRNLVPERHTVTCNGHEVPLRATGEPGTAVGAVRFKAWAPPSALHPTIDVHTPLVFDLVDRWNARSLGGCRYHVVHPGGRAYDRFPVNAKEAEARRVSRFEPIGHRPGPVDPATLAMTGAPQGGEYPRTLDLRRVRPR